MSLAELCSRRILKPQTLKRNYFPLTRSIDAFEAEVFLPTVVLEQQRGIRARKRRERRGESLGLDRERINE